MWFERITVYSCVCQSDQTAKNPLSHRIGWCDYELSLKPKQKPKSFFALQYTCGTEWFRKGTYNCERCFDCSFKTLGIQLFFSNEKFYGARGQPHKALVQEQRQLRDAWAPRRPYGEKPAFHSLPLGTWEWDPSVLGRRERAIPQFLILNFTFLLPSERWFGMGSNFHLQYTQHFERE